MLERIKRLIKRSEENGPRVDVGPIFEGRHRDPSLGLEEAEALEHLPTRDYIGEQPGDLAPDPEADARWEQERELYKQKNDSTGSTDGS
jgi:hypothetical protein